MASRTKKPLVSAAALASAAAIAAASPAWTPSLGAPTPLKLSQAAVQLTTLADVFTIPAVVWTDVLFGNAPWGGTLGPTDFGPAFAEPQDAFGQPNYVNPWAPFCDNSCFKGGVSGVAYAFFDALVNGNGNGYADYENWSIGIVNYLFEPETTWVLGGGTSPTVQFVDNGFSAATWYALQATLVQAIPGLEIPVAAGFWGPTNLTVFYNLGLSVTASLVSLVPGIGPFVGNSIFAYLGDLLIDPADPSLGFYQYGLSGTLNYWIDLATGATPWPSAAVAAPPAAATLAATVAAEEAVVPAGDADEADAVAPVDSDTGKSAPVTTEGTEETTPAEDTTVEAPAESTPAGETTVASTPEEGTAETSTQEAPAETPAEVVDPAPVDGSSDSVPDDVADLPAVDTTDSAPAEAPVKAPKRPVRDALDKVSKSIASAIGAAKDAKAAKSGAASDASDAGSADSGE